MKLPTLYKRTRTGAIQQWEIEVRGATIVTRHGQVGGAMQETSDTIKAAKSADTAEGQARAEAESKHLQKRKKGYVDSLAAAQAGAVGKEVEGGILPMLAYPYEKAVAELRFPCYLQPKLDGHRCIAEAGGLLWSRTRKAVRSVPHIAEAVKSLGLPWLDGELYNHDLRADFEKLTSVLRKQEPQPGHEIAQLHVYDIPGPGTFAQRWAALERLKPKLVGLPIRVVETVLVNDEGEMWEAFNRFLAQGYEGAIARNAHGTYENCRSVHLLKLKKFQDAEFKIVGMEEGRGKLQGHCGSFVCELPNGATFNAKMVGPLGNLKRAWENKGAWIGKQLTVKFQDYTSAGVPRFPVAMRLREDLGEPAAGGGAKPEAAAPAKTGPGYGWAKVSTKG